jgi:hypothetical protein
MRPCFHSQSRCSRELARLPPATSPAGGREMARRRGGSGGPIVLGLIGLGIYALVGGGETQPNKVSSPSRLIDDQRPTAPNPDLQRTPKAPPSESAIAQARLAVTAQTLRVRSAPSETAEIVGRLRRGEQVDVVQTLNGWHEIAQNGSALGWASEIGFRAPALAKPPPTQIEKPKLETVLTAAAIAALLVRASRQSYYASGRPCACPDDVMRNGRRCGSRSAYSRPGGASPLCYPGDVTAGMIEAFRARQLSR